MRRSTFAGWVVVLALASSLLGCDRVTAERSGASVLPDERITVGGEERAYRLVLPAVIDPARPAALVFAWHGLGDSKDLMARYSRLDDFAREHGAIVVYPNARNRAWPLAPALASADLAFFDALYDTLTGRYLIDRDRVYLTGMSNGAYFLHVLAAERADRIAAIAPHSGGLGLYARTPITAPNRYAVLVIHGANDRIVPVEEGRQTRDAYQQWGHPVAYVEVAGLGHAWATRAAITDQIWRFFQTHPRQ